MRIAFIGGGNMARAIIGGLLANGAAKAEEILVVEPDASARLRLRGLMGMAAPLADPSVQRSQFAILRQTFEQARAAGIVLDTLSMGMSDDFEAAIAEGSNMVRIGTAIFGERRKPPSPLGEGRGEGARQ